MQGTLGDGERQAYELFLCLLREGPAPSEIQTNPSSLASSLVTEQPDLDWGQLLIWPFPSHHHTW